MLEATGTRQVPRRGNLMLCVRVGRPVKSHVLPYKHGAHMQPGTNETTRYAMPAQTSRPSAFAVTAMPDLVPTTLHAMDAAKEKASSNSSTVRFKSNSRRYSQNNSETFAAGTSASAISQDQAGSVRAVTMRFIAIYAAKPAV